MSDATGVLFDSLAFEKGIEVPVHTCTDNLCITRNALTPQATPLLNLLLRKQYGNDLHRHIEENIVAKAKTLLPNSSSAKKSEKELLETFRFMEWPVYCRDQYMKALIRIIQCQISELVAEAESDSCAWPQIESWLKASLFPYALLCFGEGCFNPKVQEELRVAATAQLALGRSKGLFDMVAEFPDSLVGLKELRDCMKVSDTVGVIGQSFRAVLRKRLLHMGASTTQILDFYVSMIKALRVLDPSDFLLNYVAAPVRKYLFTRKDAVRCIVASLTEGKESELHGELKQGGSLVYAADEDDEEGGPGAHWEPRRRNRELAEPTGKDAAARGLDTLALLVSIYGSTDTFIVEYRSLLAEKLISNIGYMTEMEVANLELLKIRFGEESLHACEVMLKDVEDSKRANNAVHSELARGRAQAPTPASRQQPAAASGTGKVVDYVIISDNYWPSLPRDAMTYHPEAARLLAEYQDTYAVLKKPRRLHPAHTLGQVEVDLDFADGASRTFLVSPMQASVIMHFQDAADESAAGEGEGAVMSLRKLAALCTVEEDELLASGVGYWVSKGVLKEVSSGAENSEAADEMGYSEGPERFFQVIEAQEAMATMDISVDAEGAMQGHQESKMSSAANAQQKAELVQIEGYTKGLLSGHGSMGLERLHSMLRLLSGGPGGMSSAGDLRFDMSPQQLRQFLQGLVDAGRVEYIEGAYALCQPGAPSSPVATAQRSTS